MDIGGYLNHMLDEHDIDKINLYEKIKVVMEDNIGSYITYSRFCTKINNNSLTATEFVYIAAILGEQFDFGKFVQSVVIELPAKFNFIWRNYDEDMKKLRAVLDTWHDDEILFVNDNNFKFYRNLPLVKLLDAESCTTDFIVRALETTSQEDTSIAVEEVHYLSYSSETNELRLENVRFGTRFHELKGPAPHVPGTPGHGEFKEVFYTDKLKSYLKIEGITYDEFEKISFADRLEFVYKWSVKRNFLLSLDKQEFLEFDI